MTTNRDPYSELHKVARRRGQRGYFTSVQAQAAGMSRMQLSRLVKRGLVIRAAPSVYHFRIAAAADWKDRLAIELLATGGVACGLSAAALHGLVEPPARPRVLVPRGSRQVAQGRHTTRELPTRECVIVDGLRTLDATRAVLDSVHQLSPAKATAMVESAIVRRLVKPSVLRRRAQELTHSKRPGCAVVLRILDELHPELARSRNEWEALVARRAKASGLELPELEYELVLDGRRYIADAAWPRPRVALEFDGRDPHMRQKRPRLRHRSPQRLRRRRLAALRHHCGRIEGRRRPCVSAGRPRDRAPL